jgi:tetratricopeptide (TPR) repeat protein
MRPAGLNGPDADLRPPGAAGPGLGATAIWVIGGTAGVGKTALAVRFAHQVAGGFPDGQLYINLHGFDPSGTPAAPADALRGFLDALGVPAEAIPVGPEARAGLYRTLLAGRRMLILLDNAHDAGQVRPLLPATPGCLVLVTSRSQLTGLVAAEGAQPMTLDVLSEEEACDLLAKRLHAGRLSDERSAASELARQCARLPLALVIAAARAAARPGFSLGELAAELRDARSPLDALGADDPAMDVRAVFSWSYRQLSGSSARMFRMLAVHPGPDISRPAAASLAGAGTGRAWAALNELTQANLLTEHSPGRFIFHDLLRAYATERAGVDDNAGRRRIALHRALDYYLRTAHAAALMLHPARDAIELPPGPVAVTEDFASGQQALAWFGAERRVLLAAIGKAADSRLYRHGWQLPWTLANYLDRLSHWQALLATQRTALACAQRLGDQLGQAYAHRFLGRAHTRLRGFEDARAHLRRAQDLFGQLGHHEGVANVHILLGINAERQGRYREALAHAQESLRLFRAAGRRPPQGAAENAVGWYHACLGDQRQALAHCRRALHLHFESGNFDGEAAAWTSLGYAYHRMGDNVQAVDCYTRALDLYGELGDSYHRATTLDSLGDTRRAMSYPGLARVAWQRALALLDELHHPDAGQVRRKLAST